MTDKENSHQGTIEEMRSSGTEPTNWVPTWEVPAMIKGVEWACKGAERVREWIDKEGPLSVQILDSRPIENEYMVRFQLCNLTIHGMYIICFDLINPVSENLTLTFDFAQGTIGMGSTKKAVNLGEDKLLKPGQMAEAEIRFPIPAKTVAETGLVVPPLMLGEGRISYWMLDKGKSSCSENKVQFALRIKK